MTDAASAVGIDVGGTKIAAGVVVFPSGQILDRRRIATQPDRGGEAVLADVAALTFELSADAERTGLPFAGVGVGVAELVDLDQRVRSDFLIQWRGVPVVERLGGADRVVLDADIRAAALAEARLGAGRSAGSFAYLSVGTGIGLVFVRDGRPWHGARGSAGTFGYSPLRFRPHAGAKQMHVAIEPLASGPGLVSRFRDRGGSADRAEDVLAAASAGDATAAEVVRDGAELLGSALGFAVDLLDPELVVLGGGLGLAGGPFRRTLEKSMRKSIWSDTNRDLLLVDAQLGTDAGIVGAACGAWLRAERDRGCK